MSVAFWTLEVVIVYMVVFVIVAVAGQRAEKLSCCGLWRQWERRRSDDDFDAKTSLNFLRSSFGFPPRRHNSL